MSKRLVVLNRHEMLSHEHLQPEMALWEDGMRTDGVPSSFEWWYFDAQFSDGSTVVIVFFTKPHVGFFGGLWPQMHLIISYPDGNTRQLLVGMELYDKRVFAASKDHCEVTIGHSWVKGDLKTYEVHAEVDGRSAHLTFESLLAPWRPDMSFLYTDNALKGRFGWLPVMPYARVSGELQYAGKTVAVSGTGITIIITETGS